MTTNSVEPANQIASTTSQSSALPSSARLCRRVSLGQEIGSSPEEYESEGHAATASRQQWKGVIRPHRWHRVRLRPATCSQARPPNTGVPTPLPQDRPQYPRSLGERVRGTACEAGE